MSKNYILIENMDVPDDLSKIPIRYNYQSDLDPNNYQYITSTTSVPLSINIGKAQLIQAIDSFLKVGKKVELLHEVYTAIKKYEKEVENI